MDKDNNNEQVAKLVELVLDAKPYLRYLEEQIKSVQYGELTLTFVIRAGVIEKIEATPKPTVWMRQKQLDPKS